MPIPDSSLILFSCSSIRLLRDRVFFPLPNPILSLLQAEESPDRSIGCIKSDSSEANSVTRIPEQVIYYEVFSGKWQRQEKVKSETRAHTLA